jgi:hypothetical protein
VTGICRAGFGTTYETARLRMFTGRTRISPRRSRSACSGEVHDGSPEAGIIQRVRSFRSGPSGPVLSGSARIRRAASRGVGRNPEELLQSLLLKTGMGDRRPGEEARITADQSKQHCPFPMKAPPEGLSLFPNPAAVAGPGIKGFFGGGVSTPKGVMVPRKWNGGGRQESRRCVPLLARTATLITGR